MITVEKVRAWIIEKMLIEPKLGANYVDYHTDNPGECGLELNIAGSWFDIRIKAK